MVAPLHRCLATWCVTTAPTVALGLWLARVAAAPAGGFDGALVRWCAVVGAVAACWLVVVATAVALEARGGPAARVPGVPAPLRRILLLACGAVTVAGLAVPASTASGGGEAPPRTAARVVAAAFAGLPLPDRPHGRAHQRGPEQRPTVTVRPGDTLWDLAAENLGDGARWPELYAANRDAVGADPDLIRPAVRLRIPGHPTSR